MTYYSFHDEVLLFIIVVCFCVFIFGVEVARVKGRYEGTGRCAGLEFMI